MENKECSCGSKNTYKAGVTINVKGKRQRWHCKDCGKVTLGEFTETFTNGATSKIAAVVSKPEVKEAQPPIVKKEKCATESIVRPFTKAAQLKSKPKTPKP